MNELQARVLHTLSAHGPIAAQTPGFEERAGQRDMALAVAEVLEQGGQLVVEAGTGVGKTFAYLVPVLLAGERALVSTATKALQDQLFARDIPRLLDLLGLPVRVALLKGRSSYLCLHRMQQARHSDLMATPAHAQALGKVERWAQTTRSGDLAELSGLDERSALVPLITSNRENCLGSVCQQFRACHVNLARKEALAADVVVINHHLFFADVSVRESGVAELLPTVRVTVFDEAHQLNEIGVNFLGEQLSTLQMHDLARDLLATGLTLARGLVDWQSLAHGLEVAARQLRLAAGSRHGAVRLRWNGECPEGIEPADWQEALQSVSRSLRACCKGLDMVTELAPDFVRLYERASRLQQLQEQFVQPAANDRVRWLEVSAQLRLMESPLDIAQAFESLMRSPSAALANDHASTSSAGEPDLAAPLNGRPRAWVFTSATLGEDARLRWFTEPCGLQQARVLQVGSPFDYTRQAALYVPPDLVLPGDARHPSQMARLAAQGANALGGRTLVLTTTLQAMRQIAEHLPAWLDPALGLEVLVQGQWPKRRLMERFRQGAQGDLPGCVLVASASFWEGFDVPGSALELVIIDKLPFPPPGDPLVQARGERLQAQGRSPFADHALPEAIVALKQGAGRLIRSEADRGVLVIGDVRLRRMGYGRRMLAALPPMQWLETAQDFEQALRTLTTISTTGHPGPTG